MLDVAHDIAAIFSLPASKIVHVRDRAFNDRRYYICDKRLAALGARDFGSACLLLSSGTGCEAAGACDLGDQGSEDSVDDRVCRGRCKDTLVC